MTSIKRYVIENRLLRFFFNTATLFMMLLFCGSNTSSKFFMEQVIFIGTNVSNFDLSVAIYERRQKELLFPINDSNKEIKILSMNVISFILMVILILGFGGILKLTGKSLNAQLILVMSSTKSIHFLHDILIYLLIFESVLIAIMDRIISKK